MKSRLLHFLPPPLILLILFNLINLLSADPPVTPKDRAALRRFRSEVEHFLPHDYMKEDWYLLRWIRKKKYDLEGAKELLEKNIEWRNENNIDKLEYDPKSVYAKDFPIILPGVDKEGRPVVITDWSGDIRKYVVAGKRKALSRHLASYLEFVDRKTRELNVHQNNSEFTDLFGNAVIEESYYQGLKEAIVINNPRIFHTVVRLVTPIVGDTLNRVTFIGLNKNEWKRYLLERIPADQLPAKYGGTQQS